MLHAPRSLAPATDAVMSAVAFVLLLATWVVVYAALVPPDPHAPRHAVAEARR